MRSAAPGQHESWPHDMLITVDQPHQLLELLWVREAWRLQPTTPHLPPPLIDTPREVSTEHPPTGRLSEWEAGWAPLWDAAVAHAGGFQDVSELQHSADLTPDDRTALLERWYGPSWRGRFGDEATAAFDDAATFERADSFADWERRQTERMSPAVAYDQAPEHLALDSLISAWRSGVGKIVVIPCRGSFTRRIGSATALVTEETRNDPEGYGRALRSLS